MSTGANTLFPFPEQVERGFTTEVHPLPFMD